ncbi:hypothetical protein [Flavobacterium sp. ZS1P14]|uniref:hypothetical protein n=1 Tax=Flavobacterium sp. ZS1P14 TaxID=3401729 RepID=UPI003AAE0049
MKNLLFALTALLLFSCSSSDENSNNSDLHPPAWIQGTWVEDETISVGGFTFSKDDLCTTLSTMTTCWKYILNISQGQATAEEEISNTDYCKNQIWRNLNYLSFQKTFRNTNRGHNTIWIKSYI